MMSGGNILTLQKLLGHSSVAVTMKYATWPRTSCFCRHSFDGRYRKRVYEDYGLFNDRGLGLINAARLDLDKVFVELQVGSAQAWGDRNDGRLGQEPEYRNATEADARGRPRPRPRPRP